MRRETPPQEGFSHRRYRPYYKAPEPCLPEFLNHAFLGPPGNRQAALQCCLEACLRQCCLQFPTVPSVKTISPSVLRLDHGETEEFGPIRGNARRASPSYRASLASNPIRTKPNEPFRTEA